MPEQSKTKILKSEDTEQYQSQSICSVKYQSLPDVSIWYYGMIGIYFSHAIQADWLSYWLGTC